MRLHSVALRPYSLCDFHFLHRNTESGEIMGFRSCRTIRAGLLLGISLMAGACSPGNDGTPSSDSEVGSRGTIEVTAKLIEIPEDAIFDRPLYNYATVLKYQVLQVHRGSVKGDIIYVGHYNPAKPRSEVADNKVKDVGGTLRYFRPEQVHRMALENSMLERFSGGIQNKYSQEDTDPIYWAVWTDLVSG
jgi:hypothetical protein